MTDLADDADVDDTPKSSSAPPVPGTRHRDALRLLFILGGGCHETTTAIDPEVTHVFQSEKRLMAIDFLVRYPDYLADALLDQFEVSGDVSLLSAADRIFVDDEPSIRTVSMVRWHFGAYQKIETALATLHAYGFVRPMTICIPRHSTSFTPRSIRFPHCRGIGTASFWPCALLPQRADRSSRAGNTSMRNTATPRAEA